jgi:DCN1-like protein 1/2
VTQSSQRWKQEMSRSLNRLQRSAVENLRAFTNASQADAIALLRQYKWDMERAADHFFTTGMIPATPPRPKINRKNILSVFDRYRDRVSDDDGSQIGPDGIVALCERVGINASEDIEALILSWKMCASTMGFWTRDEFVAGLQALGADSEEALRTCIPHMSAELDRRTAFKSFYEWAFKFACDPGRASLQLESASAMWGLILRGRFLHLDRWMRFLETNPVDAVSNDTWSLTLDFMLEDNGPNLERFDDNGAWPSLVDDFVIWAREDIERAREAKKAQVGAKIESVAANDEDEDDY